MSTDSAGVEPTTTGEANSVTPHSIKLLFLGLNYAPEKVGIAVYSAGMLADAAARGHHVRAVVAKPYYPEWRTFPAYRGGGWERNQEASVDLIRCPIYVPRQPTGLKRIVHHLSFAASALPPMLGAVIARRPDVVMTTAPSLIGAVAAWLAAKLARRPSWLHVQDFELEAAFATGLLDNRGFASRIAFGFQRFVLRRFDRVSSIGPEMCAKLATAGVDPSRIVELRNWADDRVKPLDVPSSYRSEWAIEAQHVALYSGNIANKQGIEIVLDAAAALAHRRDLVFVVCGNGSNRKRLEREASSLPNIRFHDLQPTERLSELLSLATIHLLPQRADAADLVLPSKLTNMLGSARPVVATAKPGTGLAREVEGCGLIVSPGDTAAFAGAIERLIDDPELCRELGQTARQRAQSTWSRGAILDRFDEQLRQLARTSARQPPPP